MKISFLGYGSMAKALAVKWQTNHELFFAGRDAQRAAAVAAPYKAGTGSMAEAVDFAEVVVIATPHDQVMNAIDGLNFQGKLIVDINNPVNIETFTTKMPGSSLTEAIKEKTGTDVIKAFNTEEASVWASEDMMYGGQTKVTMYTADTEKAAEIGATLIKDVGSEPLLIGSNIHAYQLEALAAIMIKRLFSGVPKTSVFQFIQRK